MDVTQGWGAGAGVGVGCRPRPDEWTCGARWPSSPPLSRNVAHLQVGCLWKTGCRESGREPSSQTPTYETPAAAGKQATAGMSATVRIPATTGTPALSKGLQQEKAQPQ